MLAAALALVWLDPAAHAAAPTLGRPRVEGARVQWDLAIEPVPGDLVPLAPTIEGPDSVAVAAWRTLAGEPRWRLYALRRVASIRLAAGDTAAADSCLAIVAGERGVWQWSATNDRVTLALAHGDTAGADRLIAATEPRDWPDGERSDALALRATLRWALRDSAGAIDFGRQVIRRYPSMPAAARVLPRLERWLAVRGGSLSVEDLRAAAEVDFFRGDRSSGAARLNRALDDAAPMYHAAIQRRRGEMLRLARRFADADKALAAALVAAGSNDERARITLERARAKRDAGLSEAERFYADAAFLAPDGPTRELAWWERARELEQNGEWNRARLDYARVAHLGLGRAAEAAQREGLLWLVDGARDSALAAFARSGTEGARFWSAVVARRMPIPPLEPPRPPREALRAAPADTLRAAARDTLRPASDSARAAAAAADSARARAAADSARAAALRARDAALARARAADSALAAIARLPGYTFYRAAARDTLGLQGWNGAVAAPEPAEPADETLRLARALLSVGQRDDAGALLQRWLAADPRLPGAGVPRGTGTLLTASRIAYAAGKPALGITLARRAFDAAGDSARRAIAPWGYPPAYDSLVAAHADTVRGSVFERALLMAIIWQESKFDPVARSRSAALGLMQLKSGVAASLARRGRERAPDEQALGDPAINVKLGHRLLEELNERFDGQVTLVLAAYNAGPAAALRWQRPELMGGEALECELFAYAETQDYVKSILAARQAYRELAPRAAR